MNVKYYYDNKLHNAQSIVRYILEDRYISSWPKEISLLKKCILRYGLKPFVYAVKICKEEYKTEITTLGFFVKDDFAVLEDIFKKNESIFFSEDSKTKSEDLNVKVSCTRFIERSSPYGKDKKRRIERLFSK